ncbi:unnamed protein product [Rhizophagus irregularis]|uniref:Uncharacterized protein n=1 Tax=Rhizophagus irregularis TaxID=588596 RepID=A0A2I1FUT5_9GLOM|nr:hypothetical protein RhiirA4_391540 [Rhizophagus irregularis]CAB4435889.1 unnamed protein product [Rhizophagus irregularis]
MTEPGKVEKAEKESDIEFKTDSVFSVFEFKIPEKNNSILFKRNLKYQTKRHFYIGCFYVFTVLAGSFYGSNKQKSLPSSETSWFNLIDITNKSNLINQYIVKNGWFWTSFIFIIYATKVIHANNPLQIAKSVIRWILATLYWYIITQRCFGPSIIDRIFVYTGGRCDNYHSETQVFEAYVCKKGGGRWVGGRDLSGHCFLLIHASLLLWDEISAFTYRPENWEIAKEKKTLSLFFVFFLFLWWSMLVVTAIYFHDFFEKFTGTIFGVLYWIIMCYVRSNWIIWLMPHDLKDLEEYEL